MKVAGFTLRFLTRLALALAVDIVIDDAIVLLENLTRGIGAALNQAIAGIVVGGQTFSLLQTSLAVAVVYSYFDDAIALVRRIFKPKPVDRGELELAALLDDRPSQARGGGVAAGPGSLLARTLGGSCRRRASVRAVVLTGPREVSVQDVPDPRIEAPTDAIVRITSAAVCGSDLHMYAGRTAAKPGLVLGHEPLGIVEETGPAVRSVRRGARVFMPFHIACGACFNCKRGFTSACLATNPGAAGAAYGYVGLGPYRGAQAQYLRVPIADQNCVSLPGEPEDALEDDFVMLADVFPTGWYATDLAGVEPGSTVAVFGAGPVGLMAAYSALLRDAAEVFVIDCVPERLALAERMGARPIDFTRGDPVEQILDLRARAGAPPDIPGVMCGIEAVGYQAVDWDDPPKENPVIVLEALIRLVNATGRIGAVGLYVPHDPGGINPHAKRGEFRISFGRLWEKGLSLGTGQTPVLKYASKLRDLVVEGRARPSVIVSHRVPLNDAPDAYAKFDARAEGYCKVILKPRW